MLPCASYGISSSIWLDVGDTNHGSCLRMLHFDLSNNVLLVDGFWFLQQDWGSRSVPPLDVYIVVYISSICYVTMLHILWLMDPSSFHQIFCCAIYHLPLWFMMEAIFWLSIITFCRIYNSHVRPDELRWSWSRRMWCIWRKSRGTCSNDRRISTWCWSRWFVQLKVQSLILFFADIIIVFSFLIVSEVWQKNKSSCCQKTLGKFRFLY